MRTIFNALMQINLFKRLVYMAYFLFKADWRKIRSYAAAVRQQGIHYPFFDPLFCTLQYGTNLEDYYELSFFNMSAAERAKWAGTGIAHEFHRAMNAPDAARIFRDKYAFATRFSRFFGREFRLLTPGKVDADLVEWFHQKGELVVKPRYGTIGAGIRLLHAPAERDQSRLLLTKIAARGDHLLEERIWQHPRLTALHPHSVNTVRITTILDDDRQVQFISAILRIGNGRLIDNFSAGGMAARIAIRTGLVEDEALYVNPFLAKHRHHPATGTAIVGFPLPDWPRALELIREAALIVPSARSIGWDIAFTETGPILVEGNDNWNKTIVQQTNGTGLIPYFSHYIDVGAIYPGLRS